MTHLLDEAARRLRSAWTVALRGVAAGVFGLAIAATVAVFVAGPETRDEWRALPARVASGEIRVPLVGDFLAGVGGGALSADATLAESRAERAASRGDGRPASADLVPGLRPFVASGEPAVAAPAVPEPGPTDGATADASAPALPVPAEPELVVPDPAGATTPAAPVTPAGPAAPVAPTAPAAPAAPTAPTAGMNEQAAEVLRLVNAQRVQAGCTELRADPQLTTAAQLHSEDMSVNDYMSHTSKDGRSPAERAKAQGYSAFSGENVAKGYRSAADVMDGWMNSPGHRANILRCESVAIGVGVSGDAWTQVFGYA